jgi:hypothetical protein
VRLFAIAALTGIAAGVARAEPERAPPDKAITAARARGPIAIDGVLDDPTWRAATWTSDFLEKEPNEGAPPAHRTEIAIAFDDDALYVGARMWSDGPDDVDAAMTRRDDGTQAERIIVSLDPFRTRHVAYSFAVTAGGTRIDWVHTDDDEHERDYSWDPVWEAKTKVLADGWSAEMRIPLGQLRYPRGESTWGVDFNRYIPHRQEDIFWIVVPKDVHAWSSWFGELRGLALAPARHVELIPYATVGADLLEAPTGPLERTARGRYGAGGDVRLGLGPGLNLIGTVNPDFAQVEADPAIVNLTAYEIALPELRPFFIEGSQIFATAGHEYFYSRRIGGLPSIDLTYDQLQPPSSARIYGATKLTGALAPGTNVGAIAAVTGDEDATLVDAAGTRTVAVAPLTAWGVARVEHELGDAGATTGATITTVARELSDPTLAAQLARLAVTGGADLRLRPDHGRYELSLDAGVSDVQGSAAAITRISESSTHYFQRPDQPHVHLDPTATELRGWHAGAGAAKRDGEWLWGAGAIAESPALELNDAGILASADNLDWNVEATRQETTPSEHLHAWSVSAGAESGWNFGAIRKPGDVWADVAFTLPSFASTGASVDLHYPGLLDDLTRGGPLMRDGAGLHGEWRIGSTPNRPTVWNGTVEAGWSETGPRGVIASGSLISLLTQRLRLQLTPRVLWQAVENQYVSQLAGGGAETYGTRYLFAHLAQRELATELRAELALTPDLALDVYVEPFASVGRYTGLGELAAPRTSDVRRYTDFDRPGDGTITVRDGGSTFALGDPDFTTVSLRSTVVLRWEIRPGSILYAVWQENRGRTDATADPSYRVLGRPFAVPGEHIVALKLTWWFAP